MLGMEQGYPRSRHCCVSRNLRGYDLYFDAEGEINI